MTGETPIYTPQVFFAVSGIHRVKDGWCLVYSRMIANDCGLVAEEFSSVDFGDKRLNKRLKRSISDAAGMGESTPDRAKSNAAVKATYRLIDNPKVDMDPILACHNQSTIDRCSSHECVYLFQDTTEIDLTKPKVQVEGAGPLGTDKRRGFFYHPLYAITSKDWRLEWLIK